MLQVAIGRLEEKQLAMLMDKITAKNKSFQCQKTISDLACPKSQQKDLTYGLRLRS